jgi:CHASE2 domain-containing sensor protein
LPLKLTLKDGEEMDSFSMAIVRAVKEAALNPVKDQEELPFLRYLPADAFDRLSPTKVLDRDPKTWQKLWHKTVIVGGNWHTRAYGRGAPVDNYYTPVGPLPGALLHANYVEALIDNRTSRNYTHQALKVIEAVATLIVAIIFALLSGPLARVLGVLAIVGLLVLYGYLSLLVLGMFYDFFVPVLLVIGHALYEWLEQALSHKHKAAG